MLTAEDKQTLRQVIDQRTTDMTTGLEAIKTATAALTDASPDADYAAQVNAYNALDKLPLDNLTDVISRIGA